MIIFFLITIFFSPAAALRVGYGVDTSLFGRWLPRCAVSGTTNSSRSLLLISRSLLALMHTCGRMASIENPPYSSRSLLLIGRSLLLISRSQVPLLLAATLGPHALAAFACRRSLLLIGRSLLTGTAAVSSHPGATCAGSVCVFGVPLDYLRPRQKL